MRLSIIKMNCTEGIDLMAPPISAVNNRSPRTGAAVTNAISGKPTATLCPIPSTQLATAHQAEHERKPPPLDSSLATAMADTLDGLSAATFLVEADGRIVHANAAARLVLATSNVLYSAAGRLTATDVGANQILRDAFAASSNGSMAADNQGLALPVIARDGTRYVARVLSLAAGTRRRTGTTYPATAAVFVNKATLDTRSLPHRIAETFKLTPAELRVLFSFLEACDVREVAEALGVAESTVKKHLLRVFAKTGTSGQAHLIKLVAGLSISWIR
jgi:DNA-binding CsgD family transcriptional regulator